MGLFGKGELYSGHVLEPKDPHYIVELQAFGNPTSTFNVSVNNYKGLMSSGVFKDVADILKVRRVFKHPGIDSEKTKILIKAINRFHLRKG